MSNEKPTLAERLQEAIEALGKLLNPQPQPAPRPIPVRNDKHQPHRGR